MSINSDRFSRLPSLLIRYALLASFGVGLPSLIAQPRMEALLRVVSIEFENAGGTAFFIEVDKRQYLVTAKHVVANLKADGIIRLRKPDTLDLIDVKIKTVLNCDPADIAVLVPNEVLIPELSKIPVLVDTKGIVLGGEVHFLGFPFGFRSQSNLPNGKYLIPFVKRATVAAMVNENNVRVFYLDGYNNPGFSGGPVVLFTEGHTHVIGVISGYRNDPRPVRMGESGATSLIVDTNAGIIVSYSVDAALKAIEKNPVGPLIP